MNIELILKTIFFVQFIVLLIIRGFFGWKVRQTGQSSWSVDKKPAEREGKWSILLRPIVCNKVHTGCTEIAHGLLKMKKLTSKQPNIKGGAISHPLNMVGARGSRRRRLVPGGETSDLLHPIQRRMCP